MKSRILFYLSLLVALVLLFNACKTKETIARLPKPEKQFWKMEINGHDWEANKISTIVRTSNVSNGIEKRILAGGSIYAMYNDTPTYYLEAFSILLMEKKAGKQKIIHLPFDQMIQQLSNFSDTTSVYASMGTSHQMGEMNCESFEVDETKDNWVEIVQQEEDYKYVWGKFNSNMVRVRTCPTARYTDTVRITNGEFYIEQP